MIPRATYRLQFHRDFTFADAIHLATYLKQLGISHVYSSPILAARAGSTHGYDVIDHTRINSELGGEDGLRALVAALRQNGLGLIVDIVPNHMAVGHDNPWWVDVLENGQSSPYATMFDIDWDPPDVNTRGKVLAPILVKPLSEALAADEIKLKWDETVGRLTFAYAEDRLPLRREDYPEIVGNAPTAGSASLKDWNRPEMLESLLGRQHFRLAHWQTAPEAINWRRFFDINVLAALRMEDEPVFESVHAKLFQLYAEGLIDGVRIDHVDGLTDPRTYCRRLRARLGALDRDRPAHAPRGPAYVLVEKILAERETLPGDWRVDGTTGYDFMNDVCALQHHPGGEQPLTELWVKISGRAADFESEERKARHELLYASFASQLCAAAGAFHRLALFAARDIDEQSLQGALELILEHFRAYRTYVTGDSSEPAPGPHFDAALAKARDSANPQATAAIDFVGQALRGELAEFGRIARKAVRHFNQLAAPLAAKAVEDTAFYRYGRLLSRNDVGFCPGTFSISLSEFEQNTRNRQVEFPDTLLATATHDHKRGEDVRGRLAVLSEWPQLWEQEIKLWFELNAQLRAPQIDKGDEYQLYQTLVGSWPANFASERAVYTGRILGWREKSLREAKLRTSWREPDASFERANAEFVRAILDPTRSRDFLERLSAVVERIAPGGALNGLVQCILRCTLPGVPDLYQGAEFWDLSLTDPDNRRPVDFTARVQALTPEKSPAELLAQWKNGQVKQRLIQRLLRLRAEEPECFASGDYVPLTIRGPRSNNVAAFIRRRGAKAVLVAVPRFCAGPCAETGLPNPKNDFWKDTKIAVPGQFAGWQSVLDAERFVDSQAEFDCSILFGDFPGAVLRSVA